MDHEQLHSFRENAGRTDIIAQRNPNLPLAAGFSINSRFAVPAPARPARACRPAVPRSSRRRRGGTGGSGTRALGIHGHDRRAPRVMDDFQIGDVSVREPHGFDVDRDHTAG